MPAPSFPSGAWDDFLEGVLRSTRHLFPKNSSDTWHSPTVDLAETPRTKCEFFPTVFATPDHALFHQFSFPPAGQFLLSGYTFVGLSLPVSVDNRCPPGFSPLFPLPYVGASLPTVGKLAESPVYFFPSKKSLQASFFWRTFPG